MKTSFRNLVLMLFLIGFGTATFAQEKDEGRFHIGLNLYDALLQNVHTQTSFRVTKNFNLTADLGYCLFRKYAFQSNLVDRVRGPLYGLGLQWRFRNANQKGEYYAGIGLLYGLLWHDVSVKIPNYYGDILDHWKSINAYGGYQANLGYGLLFNRIRLDMGLRISAANSGHGEKFFHSYMPAIGRVNMFSRRYNAQTTMAIIPSLTLSYRL